MDMLFALLCGVVGTLITQELYRWVVAVRIKAQEDRRKVELNAELGGFLKRINAVKGVREFEDQLLNLESDILESRPKTIEELDERVNIAELPDSLLEILVIPRSRTSTKGVPGNRPLSSRKVPNPWHG